MGADSDVEWTHDTFNLVWGCERVSPACKNCYADRLARRFGHDLWRSDTRRTFGEKHWNDPVRWNRAAEAAGAIRRVFCGSMCDVFEDNATVDAEREKLWPLIRKTPNLFWLLLTKRPERIAAVLPDDWGAGYPNVMLMTTIENAEYAWRADALRRTPCVARGISAEPLLGSLDTLDLTDLDWVIAGGEPGPHCRSLDVDNLRSLRDRCVDRDIAFFFKQFGGHPDARAHEKAVLDGRRWVDVPPILTAQPKHLGHV